MIWKEKIFKLHIWYISQLTYQNTRFGRSTCISERYGVFFSYLARNSRNFFTLDIFLVIWFLTSTKDACYYFFKFFLIFSMRWTFSHFMTLLGCVQWLSPLFHLAIAFKMSFEVLIMNFPYNFHKISCFVNATDPLYSVES